MADISFFEKLKVLVDVSSSSGLCIASIFIILFMAFIMITTNRKNSKGTKLFCGVVYAALIILILIQYGTSLSSMFDYMMNNFFIVVYFPNLAIYLAAIIATNIILWKTIFNFKEDKLLKIINTIIYSIMHYLLVLILNVVTSNKLNVFDQSSVYSNNSALALIGLSSTIFIVWIIFIIIYKIIRSRQKGKITNSNVVTNKYKKELTIRNVSTPNIIKGNIPKKKLQAREVKQTSLIDFYEEDKLIDKYSNMLTLEDYKLVLDLLENNKSSIKLNNSKIINKSTITQTTSRRRKNYEDVEQPKLDQLLNLYKSV